MPSQYFTKKDLQISAFILSLIGIVLILISTLDYIYALGTLKYSEINGEILILKQEKTPRNHYYYVLKYQYTVNGNLYQNSKFSNGVGNIKEFERQYSYTTKVKVYFDKHNPSNSVLVKGGRSTVINGMVIIGVILLIFSLIAIISTKSQFFLDIWLSMLG